NATVWRRFDTLSPRFITLNAATIYNALADINSSDISPNPVLRADPRGVLHRDITLLDISTTTDTTRYGNDYIAGGGGDDEIIGQLGTDVIQGDGSTALTPDGSIANLVGASRDPVTGALIVSPSVEHPAANGNDPNADPTADGNDYIEGGGGSDVVF